MQKDNTFFTLQCLRRSFSICSTSLEVINKYDIIVLNKSKLKFSCVSFPIRISNSKIAVSKRVLLNVR